MPPGLPFELNDPALFKNKSYVNGVSYQPASDRDVLRIVRNGLKRNLGIDFMSLVRMKLTACLVS